MKNIKHAIHPPPKGGGFSRFSGKRWTCRGVMGVYSNLELGKAIADSCSCQWIPPLKPKDNDNFILKDLSPHELNNNDNDESDTNRDILDYFIEDS